MSKATDYLQEQLREAYVAGAKSGHSNPDALHESFLSWYRSLSDLWSLWELGLPARLHNALRRHGVETVGEARQWLTHGMHPDYPNEIAAYDMRNVGWKSVEAGMAALRRFDEEQER